MYENLNINAATNFNRVNEILFKCKNKEKQIYSYSKEVKAALFSLHDEIKRQLGTMNVTDYSPIESFVCTLNDERHIYCIGLREREVYIMEDSSFPYNPDTIEFVGHIRKWENWEMFRRFVFARWGCPRKICHNSGGGIANI